MIVEFRTHDRSYTIVVLVEYPGYEKDGVLCALEKVAQSVL